MTQENQPKKSPPRGPGVLLLGDPGQGKTFSLGTLAKHDYVEKFFYLYTDPGGDESLYDSFDHYGVPVSKLHLHYVPPTADGWDTMEEMVNKVNQLDYESLGKLKQGINKREYKQLMKVVSALANFVCDRTGEAFGPADNWPDTWAIAFDSLTGLNQISRETVVGAKPTLHQGEWGTAMAMEESLIRKFTAAISGPRVMIGHMDKQVDELAGRQTFQVALLGNKLAPKVPHMFSDVVYATQQKGKFLWKTVDDRVSLKARNLPLSENLAPDFGPAVDKWLKRKAMAETQDETS